MPNKQIRLQAFMMNCPVTLMAPGLWAHPEDKASGYKSMNYWADLARTLEQGLFDGIFISDTVGGYTSYGGSKNPGLRHGLATPRCDPFPIIPVMAQATQHLGFGVTANVSHYPPYLLARLMSTLDHLTDGRMGWNVVTGFTEAGARATGTALMPHDERYVMADEYLEAIYQLWEGSWEDGAVLADRETGVYADAERIHEIHHAGKYVQMTGVHMVEPSPQRTPVIFQAGASAAGKDFAARHAECIFHIFPTKEGGAKAIGDIRRLAREHGRDPSEILMLLLACVIVDETEAGARAKLDEYRRYLSAEGSLVVLSGYTGIDFSTYDLDAPFPRDMKGQAVQSVVDQFTTENPNKEWTIREVAEFMGIGGRGPVFVGTAQQVADDMQAWMEATDADGFTLNAAVQPQSFEEFVKFVVPELQRRGVYKTSYAPGTLREKLYGAGRNLLPATHPAARFRRAPDAANSDAGEE